MLIAVVGCAVGIKRYCGVFNARRLNDEDLAGGLPVRSSDLVLLFKLFGCIPFYALGAKALDVHAVPTSRLGSINRIILLLVCKVASQDITSVYAAEADLRKLGIAIVGVGLVGFALFHDFLITLGHIDGRSDELLLPHALGAMLLRIAGSLGLVFEIELENVVAIGNRNQRSCLVDCVVLGNDLEATSGLVGGGTLDHGLVGRNAAKPIGIREAAACKVHVIACAARYRPINDAILDGQRA